MNSTSQKSFLPKEKGQMKDEWINIQLYTRQMESGIVTGFQGFFSFFGGVVLDDWLYLGSTKLKTNTREGKGKKTLK